MIPCFSKNKKQYYITAYGLAVQQGYEGTLEEWLDSLKGDDVELRYQDSVVQWRRIPGAGIPEGEDGNYPWQDLFDVAELQGTVVAETLDAAQLARRSAEEMADAAKKSAEAAQQSEKDAAMEAQVASIFAQEAALSARVVGALPVTLTETDGVITADKTREQIWSAINNGIQVAVKYGYFHFGLSRIRTPENILRFTLLAASEADEREEQIYLEVTKDDVWTKGTVEKAQLDGRYIAEYGVSTYADIYNAFTADKSVYCKNGYYVLPMTFYQNQSNTAKFSGTAWGEEVVWQVKTGEWSSYNAETGGGGLNATASGLLIEILRNGVYSTDQSENITALATALSVTEPEEPEPPVEPDEPDVPVVKTYTITNKLTNVTSNNATASVNENASYDAILTASEGYELDSVTVTMGGTDITATAYASGVVTIGAVTGNVVITAVAVEQENGGGDSGALPEGVTQVAYLESDGASYINTEHCLKEGEFWELGCDISDVAGWKPIVHAFDGNCQVYNSVMGTMMRYARSGPGSTTYAVNSGARIDLSIHENVAIKCHPLDGSYYTECIVYDSAGERIGSGNSYGTEPMPDMTKPLYLFAGNNNGTAQDYVNGFKVRWFKVVDSNGNELRNYIPITDTSGVPCMYETTQGTYHYNQGTGSFTVGEVA